MKWRLRWWWAMFKRRLSIRFVLGTDQCWFGFTHTRNELLSWLNECDLAAQIELYELLGEQIDELKAFRDQ